MKALIPEIDMRIAGDGAFVRSPTISSLVIADPHLRCIDLVDSPAIRSLDLRACSRPVHLTVRNCPSLERVWLPCGDEGACVHWDFDRNSATVRMEGSISVFDCCLADGRSAQVEASGSPYKGALIRIEPSKFDEHGTAPEDPELVMSLARGPVDPSDIQRRFPKLRALHLLGADLPETVELHAPALESVTIADSSSLSSIVTSTSVANIVLLRCRALSRIVNSGHSLRVEGGRAPELKLEGGWNRAHFTHTTSTLISGPIDDVSSHGCPHICPARINMSNATKPLAFLPTADCINDPQWRALIIGWITRTANRTTILPALKLIGILVETGLQPDQGWRLRETLAENTARRALKARCRESWSWDTPEDLAFETYAEDLALWLRCRATPTVAAYHETLSAARGAMQIAALVKQLSSPDPEAKSLCLAAVSRAMARVHSRKNFDGTDDQVTLAIKQSVEMLVPRRAQAESRVVLARLPRFIASIAADTLCLEVLSKLAALGLSAANVELLSRARALAGEQRNLAARFHAAAFAPRVIDILADIELETAHA